METREMNEFDTDDNVMVDIEESNELDSDAIRASIKRCDCKKYDRRTLRVDPYADKDLDWEY